MSATTQTAGSKLRSIAIGLGCAAIGLTVWIVTMASAPRYSYGPNYDDGNSAFWWVLLGVALAGGFLFRRHSVLIGVALGLPPFLLSPWTAPRGDNTGLWALTVPFLFFFTFVLVAVARGGGGLRSLIEHVRDEFPPR